MVWNLENLGIVRNKTVNMSIVKEFLLNVATMSKNLRASEVLRARSITHPRNANTSAFYWLLDIIGLHHTIQ